MFKWIRGFFRSDFYIMIKDNKDKYASWDCKYRHEYAEDIFVFSKGSISIKTTSEVMEHSIYLN